MSQNSDFNVLQRTTIKIDKFLKTRQMCEKCDYVSYYDNRFSFFECHDCGFQQKFVLENEDDKWNTHFSKKRVRKLQKKYGKNIVLSISN